MTDKVPYVSEDLLQFLERVYPDKVPERSDADRLIWIKCGEVGVVRYLRRLYEDQHEEQLGE